MTKDQIFVIVSVAILLLGVGISTVMHETEDDGDTAGTSSVGSMLDSTRAYLGSGRSSMITAAALYANLDDGYTGNDPFILSLRSAEDYEKGHIPGAVNIGFRSVFTEDNLSKLPTNKQIVVYCYTGHTASQITAMLNVYGLDAVCLKWGMISWTSETSIASGYYDPSTTPNYPVFVGEAPGSFGAAVTLQADIAQCGGDDPVPTQPDTEVEDDVDLGPAMQAYLSSGKAPAMSSGALHATLTDGDAGNDPFILSVRSASQYAKGHIPGTVNIGFTSMFTDENLAKLPDDGTQIVVVCYTGHTASQATALLNINGYDAIALKFGMTSWTTNKTAAPSGYNRATDTANYPVTIGNGTGDLGSGVIADTESVILDATNDFLGSGKGTMITAAALYANLNDGYTANDPFILSIRSAEQFAIGHIPGAVNIPFRSVFTDENLSVLPTDRQIVVYCFTGHTASQITALLNVIGYDAVCLKWGMCSWTTNTTIAPSCYDPATAAHDYPVASGSGAGNWSESYDDWYGTMQCGDPNGGGETEGTVAGSVFDILRPAFNNYLAAGKPAAVTAASLYDNLNDSDPSNDPFVLSIRKSSQYEIGHIPGAVNIGFTSLFTEESMALLPDDDTQIVVVCYTGHTASQATALLNVNGYNATALKWAMTSWSTNTTIAPSRYDRGTACHNYPVSTGNGSGDWSTAVIAGMTDEEILLEAAAGYLGGGMKYISAADLNATLDDGNETNDPFVLSIRKSSQYAIGHIPGAVNMPWRSLFTAENLSALPGDDTQIVVVCYTGQTASQVTALLNVLGYNASTLKHGMCSWSTNTTVSTSCFNASLHQSEYPIVSGGAPGAMSNGCGDDGGTGGATFEGSADEWEMLRQKVEEYVSNVVAMTITAKALYNNLDDGYTANDPYIISLRGDDYNDGHVPGAERYSAGTLFDEENLAELPTDKQIVVYCFTGQSAGHVSAMLNIAGYDAISLKYGMCSWNSTAAASCYDPVHDNYRISTGDGVGDWEAAVPL